MRPVSRDCASRSRIRRLLGRAVCTLVVTGEGLPAARSLPLHGVRPAGECPVKYLASITDAQSCRVEAR